MKAKKIKRYRLGISRTFPLTHPRKGESTYFIEKIDNAIGSLKDCTAIVHTPNGIVEIWPKIHTIRGNYPLWEKRMKEVQEGLAVIELFYWSGKPYHKDENGIGQVVFATLNKDSGCGIQALILNDTMISGALKNHDVALTSLNGGLSLSDIAKNDGLSLQDLKDWFKGYDLSETMAIIHFTSFRY